MKEVPLSQGKVALVDDEDYDRVMAAGPWYADWGSRNSKWYAKRRRTKKFDKNKWKASTIRLHHFVLDISPSELPEGHVVDHIEHDGLDCRKSKLEIITQEENMRRSEGWQKKKPKEEPSL